MSVKVICSRCKLMHEQGQKCPYCAKRYNRSYNKVTRDKEKDKFYHSRKWQKVRREVIAYYNGVDIWLLGKLGELYPCERCTVHHIKPYELYPTLQLDFDNLVPLSSSSHNMVHDLYDSGRYDEAVAVIENGKQLYERIKNGEYKKITKENKRFIGEI